jgi:S1-C subfamily serine protease
MRLLSLSLVFPLVFSLAACSSTKANTVVPTTKLLNSVFRILVDGKGSGTAFVINDRALLTAKHVCEITKNEEGVTVVDDISFTGIDEDGHSTDLDIQVTGIWYYKLHDLCVIETAPMGYPPIKVSTRIPNHGDKVRIIGAPIGILGIITEGFVGQVDFNPKSVFEVSSQFDFSYLLLSCPIMGGNSGGPVLNERGELIGVAVAGFVYYPQISLAVDLFHIRQFLDNINVKYVQ